MERGWWHIAEKGTHEEDWRDPQLFRVLSRSDPGKGLPPLAGEVLAIFAAALAGMLPCRPDDGSGGENPDCAPLADSPHERARP